MPPETRQHLHEIRKAYLVKHGIEGAYEKMKNRTASQIFAEYQPIEIKPKSSGQIDDVRYELYEPPRLDATDDE